MRKNLLYSSLAILLFLSVQSTFAQTRIGLKGGLNLADMNGKSDGESVGSDTDLIVGFHVGVVADITFADSFFFQPGLLFSTKGFELEQEVSGITATATTNLSYLEVPLNVGYRIDAGGAKINLMVGPYVGYAIGGNIKTEASAGGITVEEEVDLEFGNDAAEDDLRTLDYGVNIGAGVEFSNFAINAQYGIGLANLVPEGDSDNSARNAVIGFSVGYFFGL